MKSRGDCGRRPLDSSVPGGVSERAFIPGASADGLVPVATFVPLHVVIGGAAAPAELSRGLVRYLGVDVPPAEQAAYAEAGVLGTESSPLFDRCPLAVASPACLAPAPAEWLAAAMDARSLAAAGMTGWMPARGEVTDAVRAAAVEVYAAAEAAAAYRRGFKPEMPAWS